MEKDLSKDWPEVTVVRTTGELEERPMSMYTETMLFRFKTFCDIKYLL